MDYFVLSETKIDSSFPSAQFEIDNYEIKARRDRNCNGGGLIEYDRKGIVSYETTIIIIIIIIIIFIISIYFCKMSSYVNVYKYCLHQTQQHDLKKNKQTRSKDPVEDIVILSAGTIFVIRQKLALKRDY